MTSLPKRLMPCIICVLSAAVVAPNCQPDGMNPLKNSDRGHRHKRSATSQMSQYEWLCPAVTCPPLRPGCRRVEYIVYEYMWPVGPEERVQIRCEGCRFCNDPPSRDRRSTLSTEESAAQACDGLICPSVPRGCRRVYETNVLLIHQFCKRCPACYDGTLLVQQSMRPH